MTKPTPPNPRGRPRRRTYLAHDGRHVRLAAAAARHALLVFRESLRQEPGVHTYLDGKLPELRYELAGRYPFVVGMLKDVVDALAPAGPVPHE